MLTYEEFVKNLDDGKSVEKQAIDAIYSMAKALTKAQADADRLRGLLKEMVEALEAVCFYGDEEPYDYNAYHKAKAEVFPKKELADANS